MSTTKLLNRRTNVPGQLPGISDISLGEIAINTHEGKMYLKRDKFGVVDIVQVGEDAVENVFYVSKSGEFGNSGTSLGDSFKTLDSAVSTVTTLKTFAFDESLCSRDLGYIFDGLYLDIAFGTNYNAVTSGHAYQRAGSTKVTTQQLQPTRVAFNQARGAVGSVPEVKASTGITGALYRNNAHWSEIVDILINGKVSTEQAHDDLVFPPPAVLPTADADDAAIILQNNREWLKDELIAFITANYPSASYDETLCRRDIGFIVDGLTFDILYGGTHAITINTRAYFIGAVSQLSDGEVPATVAAYEHMRDVLVELVTNSLTSNITASADETGNSGQYATSTESTILTTLLDDILIDTLVAGNLNSLPAAVEPILTSRGVSAELRTAISSVKDTEDQIILQSVKSAKNTGDTTIFLKSGDYQVNNPIKLPPKTAIVGDNLRTTTIRPKSVDSDIFYMDNGCFIKDVTFRDHQNFAACVAYDPKVDSAGAGPFIVQSPYVQNCTSITNDGIGMKIDGSKCSGLRSMVSDAFTQYNAGGIGTYLLNRGYAQLVSIFTISTQTSILAETGGQCSITNSNSSFGDFGLIARGSSEVLYDGNLDSAKLLYDDTIRISNVINRDSADYFGTVGQTKLPNYGDAMKFDSEEYYYTVLGVDSVGGGVYDISFEPGLNSNKLANQEITFRQRSQITSSSHTFEYVGAGTNTFTAIPQNGGIPIPESEVVYDVDTNEGLVVFTSTDQLGDFRIGSELTIKRQEGRIVGETFERSLYAILTPYILALEG